MTKHEIIDETVEFYSKNPRATFGGNTCEYKTSDGRRCAHSRCLTDEALEDLLEHGGLNGGLNGGSADMIIAEFGDECHKEQYKGHSVDFWNNIQNIHDRSVYWIGNKLSEEGKSFVESLKRKWS